LISGSDVRAFVLSLPEAHEVEQWGHPTFRVRDKIFASLAPDEATAGVKASLEVQQALVNSEPETFGVADYVGRYGWMTVQLTRVEADEMKELITEAWRRTAPKKLVKQFDAAA
jgi:hypothetical protein